MKLNSKTSRPDSNGIQRGEVKSRTNIFVRFLLCAYVLLIGVILGAAGNQAMAATLSLTVDGTATSYTGKQVAVTLDGTSVDLKGTPGIVINGTSYVSYKNVFGSKAFGATTTYDSTKKTITIIKNDKTLIMTLGSKTATLNGSKITLSAAPIKVTYKSKSVTKILVPTQSVVEALGYTYSWSSTSTVVTAKITTPLIISYSGSTYTYTGTEGKVTINGSNVELGTMPSIVVNGVALLRASKVFNSKTLGTTYTYDKTTKQVTISNDGTTIVLTLNSKTAYVNGTAKTLTTAPLMVKNVTTGTSYVMVPGNFVATNLGLSYTWNSSTKTSVIATKSSSTTESGTSSGSGSSGNTSTQTGILAQYTLLSDYTESYQSILNTSVQDITNSTTSTTAVISSIIETKASYGDRDTFTVTANSAIQSVSSSKLGTAITILLGNTQCTNQTYTYNNSLVSNLTATNLSTTCQAQLTINLVDSNQLYNVSLSSDLKTLTVEVYSNYITSVTVGADSESEYVEIITMNNVTPTIDISSSNVMSITMNGTFNGVGAQSISTSDYSAISLVRTYESSSFNTTFTVKMIEDSTYELDTSEDGKLLIRFNIEGSSSTDSSTDSDYALLIAYPDNVKISAITDEDDYLNKKFQIIIPGNYVTYYKNNPITVNSSKVKSTAVTYSNSNTIITVTTTSICGYKYEKSSGYLAVTVDKPSNVYSKIIVLDPGHGGTATGAVSSGVYEKTLTYKILYTYVKALFDEDDQGIKVYYTRTDDSNPTLYERQAFAATLGADLFVSLHMNSATSTSAAGTEVYYYSGNTATMGTLTSKAMATAFCKNLVSVMNTTNRGVKSAAYVVIKNSVPAVLIELGFMSNSSELSKLTNTTYQKKAAQSIYDTIVDLFEDYPTGR